jgi:hypothetical protein
MFGQPLVCTLARPVREHFVQASLAVAFAQMCPPRGAKLGPKSGQTGGVNLWSGEVKPWEYQSSFHWCVWGVTGPGGSKLPFTPLSPPPGGARFGVHFRDRLLIGPGSVWLGSDQVWIGQGPVRTGSGSGWIGSGLDWIGPGSDWAGPGSDRVRIGLGGVRFGLGRVRFGSGRIRFGSCPFWVGSGAVWIGPGPVWIGSDLGRTGSGWDWVGAGSPCTSARPVRKHFAQATWTIPIRRIHV